MRGFGFALANDVALALGTMDPWVYGTIQGVSSTHLGFFSTFRLVSFWCFFFKYPPGVSGVWEPRQGVGCILRTVSPPSPKNRLPRSSFACSACGWSIQADFRHDFDFFTLSHPPTPLSPPLPPPPSPRWLPLWGGGGGVGGRNWLTYCGHFALIQARAPFNSFFQHGTPSPWRGDPVLSLGIQDRPSYGPPW